MTESVFFGREVFGVVVVIGNELFGCADSGKMDSRLGKARLETVGNKRIGDVLAVPGQEKVHAVDSGCGQMKRVAGGDGWDDAATNQFGGESLNPLGDVQKFQSGKELKAFGCFGRLSFTGFVEHELGGEQIEPVSLAIPPLSCEFLPCELQKIL